MNQKVGKKSKSRSSTGLVSYGSLLLSPVVPGPEVEDLCDKIDLFYSKYPKQHKRQKASDLIKGAFYAIRPECRSNPDWMSQAANSARDVLYPLFGKGANSNNLIKLFKKYAENKNDRLKITNKEFIRTFDGLDRTYKKLSDLTHHGTELKGFSEKQFINLSEKSFENLLNDFISVLSKAFAFQQIYIHTIIDLISKKKRRTEALRNDLRLILGVNFDAYQYFFAQANDQWIDWLWENGFLDSIKQKSADSTKYGYRTPELDYLVRVAGKTPIKVTKIILDKDVAASPAKFNPEVIDRFVYICSELPAKQLTHVVKKIRDKKWVSLMGAFNHWGFEYEKMIIRLADAKDYDSILILAEAILSVRPKSDADAHSISYNPFYFNDLSYTKVFEHLSKLEGDHAVLALGLATKVITEIISVTGELAKEPEKIFSVYDRFLLLDIDFFTLKLGQSDHLSGRDNIKELAALIKELSEKTIGSYNTDPSKVRSLYEKYFKDLPDSRSMWRLKLFVLTIYPEYFKDELKKHFWKLFGLDNYSEILSGAEYERALQKSFTVFTEEEKRDYIKRVIEYFKRKDETKKNEKENWHLRHGSEILSVILDHLTENEKEEAKKAGFIFDPAYEPEPSIGRMRGGTVVPRGPITEVEFNNLSLENIAIKMRSEWRPEGLLKQNTGDDFLRPLNAEGVGDLLRKDIPKRLQEYVDKAILFFERDVLDQHYTYSYLRGIQELIRTDKINTDQINWDKLIDLFISIKDSGEAESFDPANRERHSFDAWLAGWNAVNSAMTDMIQELLRDVNGHTPIDFPKHRDNLFGVISYLLNYPDPTSEDEKLETAKIKVKDPEDAEYSMSDPFTSAINTVRGRAFQAFEMFVFQDGKKFAKEDNPKISAEVKNLYESVLTKENTLALMFMFGHYIPSFYYRDVNWVHSLVPQIFPLEDDKKDLYLAAWEGYLSSNLYGEIFSDSAFIELYSRAIAFPSDKYTKRRYFRKLDEGLATHIALAFLYFDTFGLDHELFKNFWKVKNTERHSGFISFIGRHYISGEDKRSSTALTQEQIVTRLKEFWDWELENCNDPKALAEFGYWISVEKKVLDNAWLAEHILKTLEKTKGDIEWEYGLMKSVVTLAKEAPEDTSQILRLYLTNMASPTNRSHGWIYLESEVFEALKVLYSIQSMRERVRNLVNDLLPLASGRFWKLKEIIN